MNQLFFILLLYTFGILIEIQAKEPKTYNFSEDSNNTVFESKLCTKNVKYDMSLLLKSFAKIDYIFENLIEINIESKTENHDFYRHKRQITLSQYKRSECIISKDELIEMNNEIEKIFQSKNSNIMESKCNFNAETSNCPELIKLMKCGIQHLKIQFIEITSNDVSSNEVIQLKNNVEKLNQVYLKVEDDLNRFNDQKYKKKIDDLFKEMQHLKQIIDKLVQDVQIANENIKQITIELCSSEIHSKKVHQCVEKLNKLTNVNYTDVINKIIQRSFSYIINDNEMIIINYIIDFINTFDLEFKYAGYETLYSMMYHRNFLFSPYILTFASKVYYQKFNLETYVKNIIDKWSEKIRNLNNWEIYAYAKVQDFSFCYYLKVLIANAHGNNINNVKNIKFFLDNLPTLNQKALGYTYLYNEIKIKYGITSEEIIMLIFKINDMLKYPQVNELERSVKINLEKIISELPSWMKSLLLNQSKTVISRFNNYKLISLHKYFGFIYIDTILAICPSSVNDADKWRITAQEEGAYFKITNVDRNHDKEYDWKITSSYNGGYSYFVDKNTGNKLYTKDTIGGWSGFWYAIPKNCYQIYDDNNNGITQEWLIF